LRILRRFAASFGLLMLTALSLAAQQSATGQYFFPAVSAVTSGGASPEAVLLINPEPVSSQTSSSSESSWPLPYVYGGMALTTGGGYSPAAGSLGGGLDLDNSRLIALAEASVENAHKLDSGTGTELHLLARSFLRTERGWYFGGGAQWNKLSTVLYDKQAWRPVFGGGKDFTRESFSARAQVVYLLPGTDHLNAVQGPEISLWLPSPASSRHFFYRQTFGVYGYHQTSVPGNPGTNIRSMTSSSEFTVLYRF